MYTKKKIQLINFFTNLGKLKAFYKVMKVSKNSIDLLVQFFIDEIKQLRVKMEETDLKIVDLVRKH